MGVVLSVHLSIRNCGLCECGGFVMGFRIFEKDEWILAYSPSLSRLYEIPRCEEMTGTEFVEAMRDALFTMIDPSAEVPQSKEIRDAYWRIVDRFESFYGLCGVLKNAVVEIRESEDKDAERSSSGHYFFD